MKFGVIIFPGSNCDHDAFWTIQQVAKQPVTFLWHESHDLENCDAIIVPGGFAFGDYLRTGAIAKFSPVMDRSGSSPRWRLRPRNLQWIPDPVRIGLLPVHSCATSASSTSASLCRCA